MIRFDAGSRRVLVAGFTTGVLLVVVAPAGAARDTTPTAWGVVTSRISVSSLGQQGDGNSLGNVTGGALSSDGRYAVFASAADDLVPGDTNIATDVFLRDRLTGRTRVVSVGLGGVPADGASEDPVISSNGRFVAFASRADNLVGGDTNGAEDVFVRDLGAGVTWRVSVGRHGRETDADSFEPSISADGHVVAFASLATDLVAGDTNGVIDVFVRDLIGHVTRRVSVGPHNTQADRNSLEPSVSADGRYVAFTSYGDGLVSGDQDGVADVYVRDLMLGATRWVSKPARGGINDNDSSTPSMSAHGRFVTFESYFSALVAEDGNEADDVFVRDMQSGSVRLVSVASAGAPGNASSGQPSISADGRRIAFTSDASDLVAGDANSRPDIFVRDLLAGRTELASVASSGAQSDETSAAPSLSPDGRHVLFTSGASNLVSRDTNGVLDVFVRDRAGWETVTGSPKP